MDAGRFALIALIVLGLAFAQTCEEKVVSKKEWEGFVRILYGGDKARIPKDITSVQRVVERETEVNEITLVDPGSRTAVSAKISGKTYDSNADIPFADRVALGGISYVVGVAYDTIRVAKGEDNPYVSGPGLHERFEGGTEMSIYEYQSLASAVKTEVELFLKALTDRIGMKGKGVKNVVIVDDFDALVTCESTGCARVLYSLVAKYLNIGTSAQMVTEFIGGSVLHRVLPGHLKQKIEIKSLELKVKSNEALKKILREDADPKKIWDDIFTKAVGGITDEGKQSIKSIFESGYADAQTIFKKLPMQEKRNIFKVCNVLKQRMDDMINFKVGGERFVDIIRKNSRKPKNVSDNDIKRFIEVSEDFFKKMEKSDLYNVGGIDVADILKKLEEAKNGKNVWKNLRSAFNDQVVRDLDKFRVNLDAAIGNMGQDLPFTRGMYGVLREKMQLAGKGSATFADIFTPFVYIMAKQGFTKEVPTPLAGEVAQFPVVSWRAIKGPFPIPSNWEIIALSPSEGTAYSDAFVDVIINKKADPGNFFKTIVTIWPPGWILATIEKSTGGVPAPLHEFYVTEEQSKLYRTKKAVVAVAPGSESCPSCISAYGDKKYIFKWQGMPGMLYATEDVNEMSSSIVFGHHTDVDLGDAKIDIAEAAREEETCQKKCPLMSFADPKYTAFIISTVQSAAYVYSLALAIPTDALISTMVYAPCSSCVDSWGGYYVHTLATGAKSEAPETELSKAVEGIMPESGPFKEALEKARDYLKKEEADKKRSSVQILAHGVHTGAINFSEKIAEGTNAKAVVPAEYSERGSAVLVTEDGNFVIDAKSGSFTFAGKKIFENPDAVRLYSFDKSIPGIIFPARIMYSSFTSSPAFMASGKTNYDFLDLPFVNCFEKVFGKSPKEALGSVKVIKTDSGYIALDSAGGFASTEEYTGKIENVKVNADYSVVVSGKKVSVENNEIIESFEDLNVGTLKGIVFENGVVVRKGDTLVTWVTVLSKVPKEAVKGVKFEVENEEVNVQLVPNPNAPEDVYEEVDKLNKELKKAGPISVIDAQGATVAIVRDENGDLWLSYIDKDKNTMVKEKIKRISVDPNDPSTLLIETDKGTHRIKVYTSEDGTPYLMVDGENKGVVKMIGGEKGTLIFDPDKGEWRLLAGNVLPLDEKYSQGISMEVGDDGKAHAKPFSGVYVVSAPSQGGGLVLPLFDDFTKMLAVAVILLAGVAGGRLLKVR